VRRSRDLERRHSAATKAELRRRTIVLWGDPASGKSGLIGALRSEGAKSVGDRWTLDLGDAPPDVVAYAESASLALRLRDVKEVPVRRPERAFTLPVRRWAGKRSTRSIDLTVLDPQGVAASAPASTSSRPPISATATADGILWLFEAPQSAAATGAQERVTLLRQVIAVLEAARRTELPIPVVVALTKIDRLPAIEMRSCLQDPESAVRAALGDAAFGWLVAAFPRLHCTAFSAAGTVRNAARPVGLTTTLDWFAEEWQREQNELQAAETRARRTAQVARVRRRAPIAATIAAAAAIIAFAGVAAARLLGQRAATWSSSAGAVAVQGDSVVRPTAAAPLVKLNGPSVPNATTLLEHGDAIGALRILQQLVLPDSSVTRYTADSLIAVAAIRGTEDALAAPAPPRDALELIVASTTGAIERARPGTPVVAALSLARAGACVGGRLDCPPDQVREDLAWALLLGTPLEQDRARRIRAAIADDSLETSP
jgi:hypothetical protein